MFVGIQCPGPAISRLGQLVEINYRFEVAGYCGYIDNRVIVGFEAQRGSVLNQFQLTKAARQTARQEAWKLADQEWQNRGLGGFKGWCRNEAREYANQFNRFQANND